MLKGIYIKILVLSFFLISNFIINAQQRLLDSLEINLQEYEQNDTTKVNLLNILAYKYYSVNIEKTNLYAKEAKRISENLNFIKGKAESLRLLGIYNSILPEYDKSLEYYEEALILNNKIKYEEGISKCYNNIGNVYFNKDDYSRSLDYYQKSLKIENELNNKNGVQRCYNNIGLIYARMNDYSKALDYHMKTYKISKELNNLVGIAYSTNNIGNVYNEQGNYSEALKWYEKSLEVNKKLDLEYNLANALNNIGIIKRNQKKYSVALEYFEEALVILKDSKIKRELAYCYNLIGSIYLNTKKYNKAFSYTNKSKKIAVEIDAKRVIKNSTEQLARIYAATKNYKKAYENYVIYKQLNDSIFNTEKVQGITALEYIYKFEKEKEIIKLKQQKKDAIIIEEIKRQNTIKNILIVGFILMLLFIIVILYYFFNKRKANSILAQQKLELEDTYEQLLIQKEEILFQANELEQKNIKLNKLNNTKNKFFSIVAHDLRNPFNALLGFSDILNTNFDNFDKEKQKKYIKIISESATNSYKLLENLLTWSRSQMGKITFSPSVQNVSNLIDDVIIQYSQVAEKKSIKIKNNVSCVQNAFVDKQMFLTILRNLISNAIKFSNKGGLIEINSKIEQEFIMFSVIDNGIGISKEDLSKLFSINEKVSTKGTDNEDGTGLGLILCKEFIEKHGGKIRAESEYRKGSKFIFTIPVMA